jgi:DNA-binding response OmpR family regulator
MKERKSMPETQRSILVVEPDTEQQQRIMRCLQARYRVIGAAKLAEAREQMARQHPPVIVLEPDLPDGDGLAWVRQLRENPATHAVIVICASHRSTPRDKISGFRAGADDYVVHPIDPEVFPSRLSLLMHVKRLNPR